MPQSRATTVQDAAFFFAILATAFAMGGALAHAFAMANKLALSQEEYFIAQKIYAGWDRLAYLLAVELTGMIVLLVLYWRDATVRRLLTAALLCLLAAQAVFWIFTYPANQLTANWTTQPENWDALRRQWEYSHFAGALLQTLALAALIGAALTASRSRPAVTAGPAP